MTPVISLKNPNKTEKTDGMTAVIGRDSGPIYSVKHDDQFHVSPPAFGARRAVAGVLVEAASTGASLTPLFLDTPIAPRPASARADRSSWWAFRPAV
jgi:hypothetical protein